jgi:hypothetical protein
MYASCNWFPLFVSKLPTHFNRSEVATRYLCLEFNARVRGTLVLIIHFCSAPPSISCTTCNAQTSGSCPGHFFACAVFRPGEEWNDTNGKPIQVMEVSIPVMHFHIKAFAVDHACSCFPYCPRIQELLSNLGSGDLGCRRTGAVSSCIKGCITGMVRTRVGLHTRPSPSRKDNALPLPFHPMGVPCSCKERINSTV